MVLVIVFKSVTKSTVILRCVKYNKYVKFQLSMLNPLPHSLVRESRIHRSIRRDVDEFFLITIFTGSQSGPPTVHAPRAHLSLMSATVA